MKVETLKGNIVHIPTDGISKSLLDAGIVKPVHEAQRTNTPSAVWNVGVPDTQDERAGYRICITVACSSCKQSNAWDSVKPAHLDKIIFSHCGLNEKLPDSARAEFKRCDGGN